MEFFKNCGTNIQLVQDMQNTQIHVYEFETRSNLHHLITELRLHDALCTGDSRQLWLFGALHAKTLSLLEGFGNYCRLVEEGVLDTHTLRRAADGRSVRDMLLDAIHSALSFKLSRVCGVSHFGPWMWLFRDPGQGNGVIEAGIMLRLHVKLTDTGALYATTITTQSTLTLVDEEHEPRSGVVILAPSGRPAELIFDSGNETTVVASDEWKSLVATTLHMQGITVGADTDWLPVRLTDRSVGERVVWPAQLCLTDSPAHMGRPSGECSWRKWFTATEDAHGFKNPLVQAEEWFIGAADREKAAAAADSAKTHGSNDKDDVTVPPSSSATDMEGMLETSPPFVQRNLDQQVAMSGIYPTPEDNLVLGPAHVLQQPSSDNVVPAIGHGDPSSVSNELHQASDDGQLRGHTSSSDPPAFPHNPDDLFGDMGEIDFGGDEVGDADFDFFNEDGDVGSNPGATADAEMMEAEDGADGVEGSAELPSVGGAAAEGAAVQPRKEQAVLNDDEQQQLSVTDDLRGSEHVQESDTIDGVTDLLPSAHEPQKPLSPFGIKERLLPPPIPASAALVDEDAALRHRRKSMFDPVAFRDGLDLGRKFSPQYGPDVSSARSDHYPGQRAVDISLPPKYKKPHFQRPPRDEYHDTEVDGAESESEEDSYESASSVSDDDLPPKVPWATKKRKRADVVNLLEEAGTLLQDGHDLLDGQKDSVSEQRMNATLDHILGAGRPVESSAPSQRRDFVSGLSGEVEDDLPAVDKSQDFTKLDLVYTAQLVSDQAASSIPDILQAQGAFAKGTKISCGTAAVLRKHVEHTIEQLLPGVNACGIFKLALVREPPSRALSTPASARPGQPRPLPPHRSESVSLGPEIMSILPPHVRVRRGNETYEMLPPALNFWETLSLAPSNGPKDIRAFCVFPFNEHVKRLMEEFMVDVGSAYEGSKLGSHVHARHDSAEHEVDDFEDGLAPVELGEEETLEGALRAYSATCMELGTFLAGVAHLKPETTMVVYVVDPFQQNRVTHHLCACFWQLYKAYRDNAPKGHRNQPRSDIVLQLLPIELMASPDTLVTLDSKQLGAIAKEVYDRCPPSQASNDRNGSSALPNFAAPFVELTSPPPKKINFQLAGEPPSDLLHEGSSLHLAYALSADGLWMVVSWVNATGRYQSTASFCLRGKSFAEVAGDVWERTREIVAARDVTWRIFMVADADVDESVKKCWRTLIGRPRKQPFSVTLLSARMDPELKLRPPTSADDAGPNGLGPPGQGFLTPGSTPQGMTMTVSPDVSGYNAPPTPAPSDMATATADSDSEAHLVDLTDESWGVLFSPSFSGASSTNALAIGALFKRGEAGLESGMPDAHLPCLALNVLWTVQVRPNGNVDEGNVKQAEMTVREVLKMYRGLSVLTRARGLGGHDGSASVAPVHLVTASRGAAAVHGLLS